ncbi:hypothetical protein HU200_047967 [Digitaria exilis]|uniref:F-box domain-containing protein n=1 Tax=Digitaria exilis TaxID=1010633 RepID=A0A835B295_9POAL|nr:hypothetical protein HU200_047967 [Digitaria exilis]
MASLKKFVDPDQWEAKDIVGRLGLVLHAAFLFAGFQPHGARPSSGHLLKQPDKTGNCLCLSRRYTAPELKRRKRADAAVLMLCAQGRDVAILIFPTANGDTENMYMDPAPLPQLQGRGALGVADLHVPRQRGVLGLPRRAVPLTSFMSLPDDLKIAILQRLTDGKYLARVEGVSAQLRHLMAERDGELWKTLYEEALPVARRWCWRWSRVPFRSEVEPRRWKDMYVARLRPSWALMWRAFHQELLASFSSDSRIRCSTDLLSSSCSSDLTREDEQEECTVGTKAKRTRRHRRQVARNHDDCIKKSHGVGAIHSPSSRYRWKHR